MKLCPTNHLPYLAKPKRVPEGGVINAFCYLEYLGNSEKLGFTPSKTEQPLQDTELQETETQKDYSMQEICLEGI